MQTPSPPSNVSGHLFVLALLAASTLLLLLAPGLATQGGMRCMMLQLLHIRCPFCGMTRDFALMLHGQAPHYNPASRLAFCVVYLVYPFVLLGLYLRRRLHLFYDPVFAKGIVAALAIIWVLNNLAH